MTDNLAAIVRGLTKANQATVLYLSTNWQAGPRLPDEYVDELSRLRDFGLVEREFADDTPVTFTADEVNLTARFSACWHFRLTPLGMQVRAHLLSETNDADR